MYQIIVALSLRGAEILQNIFLSISANVYAQFKHVFRQPGAIEPIQKFILDKTEPSKCGLRFFIE